jgi:hypothetical protein
MPPKNKGEQLSASEVEAVRGWIAAGAEFRTAPAPPGPAVSQHEIIPLMHLRCTVCHGLRRREAGLDLRTRAGPAGGG